MTNAISAKKAPRNYTIEFLRFMFAMNFIVIHVIQVFPLAYLGFSASAALNAYIFVSSLDIITPFISFSGYFLMANFKKMQKQDEERGLSAGARAGRYLKDRLVGMFPLFFVAMLLGMVANAIWRDYTLVDCWNFFLASIGELLGLQLSGIGMGNGFVGVWGSVQSPIKILSNSPLWFVSGMWLCGYALYYCLAHNEKKFMHFWLPTLAIVWYGACWAADMNPIWQTYVNVGTISTLGNVVGNFGINSSFINLFLGLGIGAEMWYGVQALKDKEFTTLGKIVLTVLVFLTGYVCMVRSWAPSNGEFFNNYCNIGWAAAYIHGYIFSFLVLLQKDYITTFKLWNHKIWNIPGRISMYIYMFHFPLILFIACFMGMKGINGVVDAPITLDNGVVLGGITPETVQQLFVLLGLVYAVSIVLGYILYKLDLAVIRPWIQSNPMIKTQEAE